MFQIPDWESDLPNPDLGFPKNKKRKNSEQLENLDEILVNAKKKKLNEVYKLEDSEQTLFGEDRNARLKLLRKIKKYNNEKDKKKDPKTKNEDNATAKLNDSHKTVDNVVKSEGSNVKLKKKKSKIKYEDNVTAKLNHKTVDNIVISEDNKESNVKLKKKKTKKKYEDNVTAKPNNSHKTVDNIVKSEDNKRSNVKLKKKDNGTVKLNSSHKTVNNIVKSDNIVKESKTLKTINNNNRKKERIKMLLEQSNRSFVRANGNSLRQKMMEKLKAAQFRYLNEKLYTASSNEANDIFKTDPEAFQMYHKGYQQQVKKWPVNPLDIIVKKILKMPKTHVIADMGCGEAALSRRVPQTVKSFDLVAANPNVVACNMAHTPLQAASVDVAVYCLALMGTELTQYLVEANRVLKLSGQLLIAEVESRFDNVDSFAKEVEKLGFKLKSIDKQHSVFFFLHFVKNRDAPVKKAKMPVIKLKPCLYKKR